MVIKKKKETFLEVRRLFFLYTQRHDKVSMSIGDYSDETQNFYFQSRLHKR